MPSPGKTPRFKVLTCAGACTKTPTLLSEDKKWMSSNLKKTGRTPLPSCESESAIKTTRLLSFIVFVVLVSTEVLRSPV